MMRGRKKTRSVAVDAPFIHMTTTLDSRAGPSTRSSTASTKVAASTARKAARPRTFGKKSRRTRKVDRIASSEDSSAYTTLDISATPVMSPSTTPATAPLTNLPASISANQPEVDSSPTPPALQHLLNALRSQYLSMLEYMKSSEYANTVRHQITIEIERKQRNKDHVQQLQKQIRFLSAEGVSLLKKRMLQVGINPPAPGSLMTRAKQLVGQHKGLQAVRQKELQTIANLEKALVQRLVEQKRAVILSEEQIRTTPQKPTAILVQPFQLTHASVERQASIGAYYNLVQYQQDAQAHYAKMGSRADVAQVPSQPSESSTPIYAAHERKSVVVNLTTPDTCSSVMDLTTKGGRNSAEIKPSEYQRHP